MLQFCSSDFDGSPPTKTKVTVFKFGQSIGLELKTSLKVLANRRHVVLIKYLKRLKTLSSRNQLVF